MRPWKKLEFDPTNDIRLAALEEDRLGVEGNPENVRRRGGQGPVGSAYDQDEPKAR